jgi:hypothetical protein
MSGSPPPTTPCDSLQPLPEALASPRPLGTPSEPVPLYCGPVEVTRQGGSFQAEARISFDWLPSPEVRFEAAPIPPGTLSPPESLRFRLPDGTVAEGRATRMRLAQGQQGLSARLSGPLATRVVRPADGEASYALFWLPNFDQVSGGIIRYPDGSCAVHRLALKGGGWKVALDAVAGLKEVTSFLSANGGYGVTQVGRLEREDGAPFTAAEGLPVLHALGWYLSFAAGRWTGPCLPVGFDANGRNVWEVWDHARTASFERRQCWVDSNHGEHVEDPFPGFLKLWLDEDWEEVVRLAVHWYVEASAQAGSIEGSIVLTQTAFELLASSVLVESERWLSADGYEKLAASDRIRLLFHWAQVPVEIPARLRALTALGKAENWPDAPTAMTMIRNTITHPTRKNREKFGKHPGAARTEAWWLGLWDLELCLLRLFGYRGTYANRITQAFAGEIERIPWAAAESPPMTP